MITKKDFLTEVLFTYSVSKSAVKASCLAVHVLNHNVKDLAQGPAVLQNLPWLVGMIVDLDQFLITDGQQAVTLEVFYKVVVDFVLIQVSALDQELCIVSVFDHNYQSCLRQL